MCLTPTQAATAELEQTITELSRQNSDLNSELALLANDAHEQSVARGLELARAHAETLGIQTQREDLKRELAHLKSEYESLDSRYADTLEIQTEREDLKRELANLKLEFESLSSRYAAAVQNHAGESESLTATVTSQVLLWM